MQTINKTYDKQGFVKTRFFEINCGVCDKEITTRSAEGMFEKENGAYVFLCRKCTKAHIEAEEQQAYFDQQQAEEFKFAELIAEEAERRGTRWFFE